MSIFDAIMALSGRKDPAEEMKRRIIAEGAAKDAVDPATTAAVPAAPPRIGSPQEPDPGADPNTPPPAVDPVPKAYQPVPDLSAMYQELMDRQDKLQRRTSFDQAATLMASAFARDENRDRIMQTYPDSPTDNASTGLGGISSLSNSMLAMQQEAQKQATKNQLRLILPKIAKELGLSMEDATVLLENGQLEELIKTRHTPNPTVITQGDGSQRVIDTNAALNAPPTPDAVDPTMPSIPAADGTPVPLLRDDIPAPEAAPVVEPSIPGVKVADAPPRKIINLPDPEGKGGTVAVYEDDYTEVKSGKKYLGSAAPPIKVSMQPDPNGTGLLAIDEYGKHIPKSDIKGGADLIIEKTADGRFQAINKNTGEAFGTPFGDAKKEEPTDDMKEWALAAEKAKLRGETFPNWPEWLKTLTAKRDPKPPSSNMDPATGTLYPDPPPDYTYQHTPDGKAFVMDENTGMPKVVVMPGTKTALTQADTKAKEKSVVEGRARSLKVIGGVIDESIATIDNDEWWDPATGMLAPLTSMLEGSSRAQLEESLNPVKALVAFDALQTMRDNSPTGGALSNVSDLDLRLLTSTLGSLEPRQGRAKLKARLAEIKAILTDDSQQALNKWRAKYGVTGDDAKDLATLKKIDPKAAAEVEAGAGTEAEVPAATEAPPKGAKVRRWNPPGVPTSP
jgi:hypothetical protein